MDVSTLEGACMSGNKFSFPSIEHLTSVAVGAPEPIFTGAWTTLELQPDAFAPQRFTVGVVVQSPNERLYFKLLNDFQKFDCVYKSNFSIASLREIMAHAESVLRQAVKDKTAIPEVRFSTSALALDKPRYTSGDDWEETVERLFDEVVVMATSSSKKRENKFRSIDTSEARDLVNAELKKIANMDFDRIVTQDNQGVLTTIGEKHHYLDFNLAPPRACGSVTSAVFKTAGTVELNLLKSSRDLTTYARMRLLTDIGLFLLLPQKNDLEAKEFVSIEKIIGEYEWKLERDGFRVVSLSSPSDLASEIYEWAKPHLS